MNSDNPFLLGGGSSGKSEVLPDSRLKPQDRLKGEREMPWELPDGSVVNVWAVQGFCVSCGKLLAWFPRDTTVHGCLICNTCYQRDPTVFAGMVESSEEFNRNLEAEMLDRYGRGLTGVELFHEYENQTLGVGLQMLLRETPYPVPTYGH
jgi:hypothetical protein